MTTVETVPPPATPLRIPLALDPEVWLVFNTWLEGRGQRLERRHISGGRLPVWEIADTYNSGSNLTRRQFQVLVGMAQGKSNPEIASDLYLSSDSVKTHVKKLFRRLEVGDRAAAVHKAHLLGILGGGDD
jgi:DNA-binding CsgD family transcriptional regulator